MADSSSDVKLRISTETQGDADVTQLTTSLDQLEREFQSLGKAAKSLAALESAQAGYRSLAGAASAAQQKVHALQTALGELQEGGGKASQISALNKDLVAAEKSAAKAEAALARQNASVVSLGYAARAAGVNVGALANEQQRIAQASQQAAAQILTLRSGLDAQRAALDASRAAAERTAEAFSAINFRSANAINAEILQIKRALGVLARDSSVSGAEFNRAFAAGQAKIAALRAELAGTGTALNASRAAAERTAGAFSAINFRSANAINAEILQINHALGVLARASNVSGVEFNHAFAAGQAKIAALRAELAGTGAAATQSAVGVSSALGGIAKAAGPVGAALATAFAADKIARTAVEMDSLSRTFVAISGTAEAAGREMDYVAQTANRLGLDVGSAGKAYASFTASTKGTVLEGQAARDIFEAVAGSMSQLGKSSADTEGVLLALTQMMSKGVVSMEELRGQLGERLPGAMKIAADSMGLTQQELIKLVESGQLLTVDLLPRLAAGLKATYATGGEIKGFSAEWNRLTAAITLSVDALAKTPAVMNTVGVVMLTVRATLSALGVGVVAVSEGFSLLGRSFAAVAAVMTRKLSASDAMKDMGEAADAAVERIARLSTGLGFVKDRAQAAAGMTAAQGAAAEAAGISVAAMQAQMSRAAEVYAHYSDVLEKTLGIEKQLGANAADRIAMAGTETQSREALTAAAEREAATLNQVADAKLAEATIEANLLTALKAKFAALEKLTPEQEKQLVDQQKKVDLLDLDARKTLAAADAAELAAEKSAVAAIAAQDNSKRVGELKQAYEDATKALATYRALQEAGLATGDAVNAALIAQRDALALYRDALKDLAQVEEARAAAAARSTSLAAAAVGVEIERARAAEAAAKAIGNETLATREAVAVKELEAKQAVVIADGKLKEAAAAKLAAAAKIEEIKASGDLTPAKLAEIAAIEDSVKAKTLEAAKSAESAKIAREEADAADKAARAKRQAAQASTELSEANKKTAEETRLVKRDVNAYSQANAELAERLGLSGKAAEAFSRKFSELLGPALDKARVGVGSTASYIDRFVTAFDSAQNAARQYAESLDYVNDLTARLQAASNGAGGDLQQLTAEAARAANGIAGLGDEELNNLRSALDAARQQMRALEDSAQSTLSSLQEELAQMNGNYAEAERLRYESRRADLEAQLAIARAQGNNAAASSLSAAISTLDQIAAKKIAEARTREAEELARASKTSSQASAAATAIENAAQGVAGHSPGIDIGISQGGGRRGGGNRIGVESSGGFQTNPPPPPVSAGSLHRVEILLPGGATRTIHTASESASNNLVATLHELASRMAS